ncbi:potassium channel protein [Candidatus Bathyarchaeota archaeon]|nr:potassium channel protein [Candidatus Bathyarchaeota archaeon]MCJ7732034.1 potassium channel protein [Candidatus Bathyarchaeota archaeon]
MNKVKKTEYRPAPVRETLIQMKDISELMIDLAYSAALFNNRELAEEVMELETKVDDLVYLLYMNLMLAARDRDDAEKLSGVAKIGSLTNAISDAAADIASLVIHGIEVHPAVREVFQRAEEHLARVKVDEESFLAGKTIDDLDLASEVGVDIIAIRRGLIWHINTDKEIILPEDVLVARGTADGLESLTKAAKGELDYLE